MKIFQEKMEKYLEIEDPREAYKAIATDTELELVEMEKAVEA